MGNTVLESTGLGSTQKRIRYCVSGTYFCDGIEHINRIFKKKENGNQVDKHCCSYLLMINYRHDTE